MQFPYNWQRFADGKELKRAEGGERKQVAENARCFSTCKLKTLQMCHCESRNKEVSKQNRNGMGQTFKTRQEDNAPQQT
jgi:hypothetical protein